MTSRTPESPAPPLAPTPGGAGPAAFDVAATLRRIQAVLATLEGAQVPAEKVAESPPAQRKRISFDWG